VGVLSCYTDVDGIPVVKFMIFIESSQVENPMQYVIVSVLTKHAEVDLWNHNGEGM